MADIYTSASLSPSKPEAIAAALRSSGLAPEASAESLTRLAAYRLDDPAGEVGMEVHLVDDGAGRVLQVPLTYRGAALDSAQPVVEMEHSVLGHRWVYHGLEDPLFRSALARTIAEGTEGADFVDAESGKIVDTPVATVRGSGLPGGTGAEADSGALAERVVVRSVLSGGNGENGGNHEAEAELDGGSDAVVAAELLGTWPGREGAEIRFAALSA